MTQTAPWPPSAIRSATMRHTPGARANSRSIIAFVRHRARQPRNTYSANVKTMARSTSLPASKRPRRSNAGSMGSGLQEKGALARATS